MSEPTGTEAEVGTGQHLGIVGFVRAVVPYFKPHKAAALVIAACMLVDLAYASSLPILFQLLIDKAITPHDNELLLLILGALAGGAAIATASSFVQDLAYARTGVAVLNEIRAHLFSHLQDLSLGFFSRTPAGDILSRFSSDLASVESALIWYLPSIISSALSFAVNVCILFYLSFWLALVSVLGLVVSFWLAKRLEPRVNELTYQLKEETGQVAVILQENLAAQPVVQGFGLQDLERKKLRAKLSELRALAARSNWASFFMGRIPNVGALAMGFVVLGIGAFLVYRGRMSVGQLVAFNALFGQLSTSVGGLTGSMPSVLEGAAGMERVQEILAEQPGVPDGQDAKPLPPLAREITFDRVSFGYTEGAKNLDDVSLRIARNTSVAFVGQSGSGKSTVLSLVSRFYDPGQGAVRFDGRDVREVTSAALRAQLGIVFQESILFDTTIRENIRLGRPSATDAEIEAAAQQAGVHDFILSLPDGYATRVGERGGKLSGGQRQRVAIARALVRNPSVLVLDEATSALDPETEASVNETIQQLSRGLTVLSVTHRLAPVALCDRVFVLAKGKVVEEGRHEDLLALDGVYAKLWNKQQGFTLSSDGKSADVTAERLAHVPIFAPLPRSVLEDVAAKMISERAAPGRTLIREGDPGDKFHVVARGKLEVLKNTASGGQQRVEVLADGDYFGEISLLRDRPRTATIRAITEVTYLTLKRDHFLKLLEANPEVRQQLETLVQARLDMNDAALRPRLGLPAHEGTPATPEAAAAARPAPASIPTAAETPKAKALLANAAGPLAAAEALVPPTNPKPPGGASPVKPEGS